MPTTKAKAKTEIKTRAPRKVKLATLPEVFTDKTVWQSTPTTTAQPFSSVGRRRQNNRRTMRGGMNVYNGAMPAGY